MIRNVIVLFLVFSTVSAQLKLIWEDNFDVLDDSKWTHMVTASRNGNNEFQYYRNSRKNSYIEDGVLKIRVTPVSDEYSDEVIRNGTLEQPGCNEDPCVSVAGNDTVLPTFSAKLTSKGKFSFKYGRVEVRARVPDGDWLWPAIWLMPENDTYGNWPNGGEIDILELRGNRRLNTPGGAPLGSNLATATLMWGTSVDLKDIPWPLTHWGRLTSSYADDFHIFGLEWTEDYISILYDNEIIGQINPPDGGFWELGRFTEEANGPNPWKGRPKMAPFDQPFYLILNVAVGGVFFDDIIVNDLNDPRPWSWTNGHPLLDFYEAQSQWEPTWVNPVFEIDYVRVYEF